MPQTIMCEKNGVRLLLIADKDSAPVRYELETPLRSRPFKFYDCGLATRAFARETGYRC